MATVKAKQKVDSRRYLIPELCQDVCKLKLTGSEALILLSANADAEETIFDADDMLNLRIIIEECQKKKYSTLELDKSKLKVIEQSLPYFGTTDENVFAPLRIKISTALLNMETMSFQGGSEDDTSKGSDQNDSENST